MTADFATAIAQVTLEGRTLAESNMTDRCIITREDPDAEQGEPDPDTLEYPPLDRITVYEGKCRLQVRSIVSNASTSDAGERQTTVQETEWQGPVATSGGVSVNDVIKMQTCALDPSLADHEFTVKGRHGKSQATSRRLRVEEVTG